MERMQHIYKIGKTRLNNLIPVQRVSPPNTLNLILKGYYLRHQSNPARTLDLNEYRAIVAPWLKIGKHDGKHEILSHLSMHDLLRALLVLHICSYDSFIKRQEKIFGISKSFGEIGHYLLQKTFFKQFVGGDIELDMKQTVNSIQQRNMNLMLLPVVEGNLSGQDFNSILDENLKEILALMSLASKLETKSPLFQLKLSAIIPGTILESVSKCIIKITGTGNQRNETLETKVVEELADYLSGNIRLPTFLNLNSAEIKEFVAGFQRLKTIMAQADKPGILVDAEFYACKPAISKIALAMMLANNSTATNSLIGTTIQAYLKEAVIDIGLEINIICNIFGTKWFGKVVRGAYMNWERSFAEARGESSPIWSTFEETNSSYDRVLMDVLYQIAKDKNCRLIVATHNERSIRYAAQRMDELGLKKQSDLIQFAQIYGMAEWLSAPLVAENYLVYKSIPYGKLNKVLPYLGRRALENLSVLQGTREERQMLIRELKHRLRI